jgi:putative transposase
MHDNDIRSKTARKFRNTTDSNHPLPVADNILDRQFNPSGPNEKWVGDITYIPTGEGWLYLAVIEDLYSRKVVGWSMADHVESRLVVDALEMAVARRLPGVGLLAHTDRGSQYASDHYQRLLEKHGIECSMSGVGQCWDNAPMESFFASLNKDTTIPACLHTRCRDPYNRSHPRLPVGAARTRELVPRSGGFHRRIRIMRAIRPAAPPRL